MTRFALAVLVLLPALARADWPVFRGNPEMTGVAKFDHTGELKPAWTFATKGPIDGAPVVLDGVVYVASGDKHVYAINAKTGELKWKSDVKCPLRAAPAVKGGKLFVGDSDGKFHCLSLADGRELWSFEAGGEITGGANFYQDTVLFGSHDQKLYCFDFSGKKLWDYAIEGPVNGSPAIAGEYTFVAGCDGLLHVVEAKTGKAIGTIELTGQAGSTAAVGEKQVVVGTMSNQVVGIDLSKPSTPTKQWDFEAPKRQQPFYASAALHDGLAVIGSRDKKIYALDVKTGKERWSFVADNMVDGSAVVMGERILVGCLSNDGNFYVLDRKNGRKLQELYLDSAVTSSPAVSSDGIYVGTEKGTLYCLRGTK